MPVEPFTPLLAALPVTTAGRPRRVLPGLPLALGITLFWVAAIVLLPLSAAVIKTLDLGWDGLVEVIMAPRVLNSLKLSFSIALLAALVNVVLGLALAWVLVRDRFPGRGLVDALVDLPFALPTAVAGIALTALYAPTGWLGAPLAQLGIQVAFKPAGIFVALIFIGLPFVVRTLQPVLIDLEHDAEEAARTLGATPTQVFLRVVLPALLPSLVTGFVLAFARGVGEYGSVIFIAGNLPNVSEIAPLLIVTKLEQYEYAAATGIAVVMLLVSVLVMGTLNAVQAAAQRRAMPMGMR